jgi:ATP-binding cassette, subfamily D (ALD), member 3
MMAFSVPSSTVNSSLDYLNRRIALLYRTNLVEYFNQHYLNKMVYYQICNLDERIKNPDQILTQDIDKWAQSLSNLYSNFSKPLLDIILFSKKLADLVGWQGPAASIGWYTLSGFVIKYISPAFGKMTAIEQTLEGDYRALHSELINHSEQIAFYKGAQWEQNKIQESFSVLYKHIDNVLTKKFWMGIVDSMLVKYGAVLVGYAILGLPVFGPGSKQYLESQGPDPSKIT